MKNFIAYITLSFVLNAHAGTEIFNKTRTLSEAGKNKEAIELLQEELQKNLSKEDNKLVLFNLGYLYFKTEQFEKSVISFEELLKEKNNLQEYALYYLASAQLKLGKFEQAEKGLHQLMGLSLSAKLNIDASNLLGQVYLEQKSFKQANLHFQRLESKTKGTEQYPEVIYNLAKSEKGLKRKTQMCKWLNKVYTKYPAYSRVETWGYDLASNEFEGEPSYCSSDLSDFKTRVRYMIWGGLAQRAQLEINLMKEKVAKHDTYAADQLLAQFYIQEGEVDKALNILKPYYDTKKKDVSYLLQLGTAAARMGEYQLAVGSYYSASKLQKKSKQGRQALYQAAFLSYQFQDYDGAVRRFKEFQKLYPNSGLTKDSQWHLAWLKYLKGDYQGAYKFFSQVKNLKKKHRKEMKSFSSDRAHYWMAMSLFRLGKKSQAKKIFEDLAKDPLYSYYSVAAQYRLKSISSEEAAEKPNQNNIMTSLPIKLRTISRFTANDFLTPSIEENNGYDEENESEDSLQQSELIVTSEEEKEESENATESNEDKSVEVASQVEDEKDKASPFTNQTMAMRFERSRDLMIVGLNDWAKWDLYDIERKTSNKDYLMTLISEYSTIEQFHRSSYIGQTHFGRQRIAQGIEGARYLWEVTYPRAYSDYVEKYAKKFSVPTELIWSIMRAESNYRQDAISPVGAMGLLQVMPFTAAKVGEMIGEKDFKANTLLQPEPAIKIGSRYLRRLMDNFNGVMPLVAAAYNAGPHRVKSWLVSFGNLDTDEFIEHIPFLETRNYVKKVMSNAVVYTKLYGNKKEIFPYLATSVPVSFSRENFAKENWDDI